MGPELLEIEPRELKFTFELKKQSSCSLKLINNSNHYVAFKVKTTSPKRYCVRPNTGIVQPNSICDFSVTMQAQKVAPLDMQCKDKFLIQSTIVPFGAVEEDITSSTFSKDNGKYIEENKLRVVLISPPSSPAQPPFIESLKPVLETSTLRDRLMDGDENLYPHMVDKDITKLKLTRKVENEELNHVKAVEEWILPKAVEDWKLPKAVEEWKVGKEELKSVNNLEGRNPFTDLKPVKNIEELESEANIIESISKNMENLTTSKDVEELKQTKDMDELMVEDNQEMKLTKSGHFLLNKGTEEFKSFKDVEFKLTKNLEELKQAKCVDELKLSNDIEELKLKLTELESKLSGDEITISKLRDEMSTTNEESRLLRQELVMLKRLNGVRRVQVGFPFLFVCAVALVCLALGYLLRA